MDVNTIDFNIAIGKKKPRTMPGSQIIAPCPFCDTENLTDIIDQEDNIILLKNKYNVMVDAYQLVLIETDQCHSDLTEYSREHMYKLMKFALTHWLRLINSKKYESVLFFRNFGPLSGGTLRHPHMQIIGFPKLNPELLYTPEEFSGLIAFTQNGIEVNISDLPRVGFTEINIKALPSAYSVATEELPEAILPTDSAIHSLSTILPAAVSFLKEAFARPNFSYNLFFYLYQGRLHLKIIPRFPTSPLYIGYNIRLKPTNQREMADKLAQRLLSLRE